MDVHAKVEETCQDRRDMSKWKGHVKGRGSNKVE